MTAKPRKRKKQRLSEHARLVEARAASIPPGVVHELFDTESVPQPPGPAPRRSVSPAGRFTSKPPPPPPRPSHAPDNDIPETDLDELDGSEELEELEELASRAGYDETPAYESPTQTIIPTVSPRPGERAALPPSQRRSALPAVVLGSLAALGLGLAMFADRSDTKDEKPAVVAKEPAPPADLASPEPLAGQAPTPGPLAPEPASPAPVASAELAEPTPGDAAAAPALPSSPTEGEAPRPLIAAVNHQPASGAPKGGERRSDLPAFDPEFASAAIRAAFARAQGCRSGSDPTGIATVSVTYAPSGRVTRTLVDGKFAGTSTGSCIAATLRSATIPAFSGALVTIKQSAEIK